MEIVIRREWETYDEDECSNGVVSKDGLIFHDNLERSVLLRPSVRPVLTALDPCTLDQVRYHDDGGGTYLPHQTPEVYDCPICWTCGECVCVRACVCVCVCVEGEVLENRQTADWVINSTHVSVLT